MILNHPINHDDEGSGRSADLHTATAKQRNQQARDNGCDQPGFRWRAGRDGDGKAERQGHHTNSDARKDIGAQRLGRIIAHRGQNLRLHGWVRKPDDRIDAWHMGARN